MALAAVNNSAAAASSSASSCLVGDYSLSQLLYKVINTWIYHYLSSKEYHLVTCLLSWSKMKDWLDD